MPTKKEQSALASTNGVEDLLTELKSICGVYAADIKMIREQKDGRDGSNLVLLGKKGSDQSFQKVMTLFANVSKIKELNKEAVAKPAKENALLSPTIITELEQEEFTDDGPKMSTIQDFALSKIKKD